ncbi:MAG: hypothetical protein H0T76_28460, partial [Nannocystis sp.]
MSAMTDMSVPTDVGAMTDVSVPTGSAPVLDESALVHAALVAEPIEVATPMTLEQLQARIA